jgi:ABC-2 type transport system ATP-binding protein
MTLARVVALALVVLQSTADNADLSVDEVVQHFATFYPAPRDPAAVIAAVGLSEKKDARARELSGGQRRRLDVALGILGDPELLFLDEPTTGFDPEARRQFWDLIDSLRADGTIIRATPARTVVDNRAIMPDLLVGDPVIC